jgi:Tfp pilus assembly protein PilO
MASRRHRTLIRALEITGASLVLLDAVLYFGMFRSVRSLASQEEERVVTLRARIANDDLRIDHLKKIREGLPEAGKTLAALEHDRTPPRRQAFSQAAGLVRHLTETSGTQLANVSYKLDKYPSGPVQRLGLVVSVAGPFPALLKFAHGLETASNLIVIQSFSIEPGDGGNLLLRLIADSYLTP